MVKRWFAVVLLVFFLPAFSLMLRPGIFTMHDPHLFRIFEFNRCFTAGIFPCRWAPDSGKGYGEPLFNFYTQAPYWLTESFIRTGLSILDSAKAAYILSLLLSGLTMFLFARRFWGDTGGFISAAVYVYAPYRAVDVWVRGALPEALSFVFFPLILMFMDMYLESRSTKYLLFFSLSLAALINTHNLSFVMFAPFLGLYWIFRSWQSRSFSSIWPLAGAGIFSAVLSSFYLLPMIFENRLVTLGQTVSGYYDYHIHFTTLRELFISRYWGYGASLWARKYLSVSVGQLQWIIPAVTLLIILARKKWNTPSSRLFYLFSGLGLLALFLTHGKSSLIWNILTPMKYIQFPWRFLSIAVLFLSLASGYFSQVVSKKLVPLLLLLLLFLNYGFFRPDIWRSIGDREAFSGPLWDEARSSSLTDFWPVYGAEAPSDFAFSGIRALSDSDVRTDSYSPGAASVDLNAYSQKEAAVQLPVVYFPGWQVKINDRPVPVGPSGALGLISFQLPAGDSRVSARFTDTPVRTAGNILSLMALFSVPLWLTKKHPA